MKVEFIFIIIFLISCKPKIKNEIVQNSKPDTIEVEPNKKLIDENFEDFFNNFKRDKKFRSSRLIQPLFMYQFDDSGEVDTENFIKIKIGIEEILLDQKDWKEKIIFSHEKVKQDTTITHLEGDDTGLQIQYQFIKIKNRWYLDRVTDYST